MTIPSSKPPKYIRTPLVANHSTGYVEDFAGDAVILPGDREKCPLYPLTSPTTRASCQRAGPGRSLS